MAARRSSNNRQMVEEQLLARLETLRTNPHGEFLQEILLTLTRLAENGVDEGDLKIVDKALRDLRYAFKVFAPYRSVRKVTLFGSAREPIDSPLYRHAADLARTLVREGYMVITGAGEGIMKAGQEGAGHDRSFGLNIRLPFEQTANIYIQGNPKLIHFHYFFTRKLFFVKESDALVLFPGGFGTLDEAFETLTLIQTGKTDPKPVILLDVPGGSYWAGWRAFVEREILGRGRISPEDLALFRMADRIGEAVEEIRQFYRRYHSSRYVKEQFVIRLQTPLPEAALSGLHREFADLLSGGAFTQGPALPEEANEPEIAHLPRLVFAYNRKSFGRLRLLIDRINREGWSS